jgi:L-rhamnose-H+ transport protein
VILNVRNRTGGEYLRPFTKPGVAVETAAMAAGGHGQVAAAAVAVETVTAPQPVPLLSNYLFSAVAGTTWYLQFFFYSMGETRMGQYKFSSWTMHMASIIIFSTLWGVGLGEWRGTSRRTKALVLLGLLVLIGSTIVVGYGNYLKVASGGDAGGH